MSSTAGQEQGSGGQEELGLPLLSPEMVAYLTARLRVVQIVLLLGYAAMCALSLALLGYLRYNRSAAFKGDSSAARKVLLPAFEPLLWLLGATTGSYALFFLVALRTHLYAATFPPLATECFYAGRQFVLVLVLVFMMQQSVSRPALLRAVAISALLAAYTIPVVWYLTTTTTTTPGRPNNLVYGVTTGARALLLVFYSSVLLRPPSRASHRVLREYCLFAYGYYALLFAYNEVFRRGHLETGFYITYANIGFGAFCPLVIWRVLRADTEYWRGLGHRACRLQTLYQQQQTEPRPGRQRQPRRRRQPWLDEHISSEGLHALIEMHRRYLIDFAYLELRQRIGVGASAVVFRGELRSKTAVAVKVYTPVKYDEQTVAAFSHEAALCGALNRHPNIVRFYGLCVSPPTIGLVSELCLGSLEEVSRSMYRDWRARQRLSFDKSGGGRQRLLLALCQMLDAARAVAYLHSFSPPFLHRDVKPANFLVDANGTVKLTDFGEARALPRQRTEAAAMADRAVDLEQASEEGEHGEWVDEAETRGRSSSVSAATSPFRATDYEAQHRTSPRLTVRGTVDYMAPEVINGRSGLAIYGAAADVYSLSITMWDILYPGREKYPTLRQNHLEIFEFVLEGRRPAFPPASSPTSDLLEMPPGLHELIASGWHADPRLRPTASRMVEALEGIQEGLQAAFALELRSELHTPSLPLDTSCCVTDDETFCSTAEASTTMMSTVDWTHSLTSGALFASVPSVRPSSFRGEALVQRMLQCGFVLSPGEAVRLGNALMDAGMLHHVKHASSFDNSARATFYFDDMKLRRLPLGSMTLTELGEPADDDVLATPPHGYSIEGSTSSSSSLLWTSNVSRPLLLDTQAGQCACRKYGQRLKIAKQPRCRRPRFHWQRQTSHDSDLGVTSSSAALDDTHLNVEWLRPDEDKVDDDDASTDFDAFPDTRSDVASRV